MEVIVLCMQAPLLWPVPSTLCCLQVAHAYLQAESAPGGGKGDNSTVAQVIILCQHLWVSCVFASLLGFPSSYFTVRSQQFCLHLCYHNIGPSYKELLNKQRRVTVSNPIWLLCCAQVVELVSKAATESNSEAVHLAVIRALLTITTAEHFIVHGDSLMQAVRCVFNIALGSSSADIQRTARSALLQMLNTVVKRVTSYSLVSLSTQHTLCHLERTK